MGLQNFNGICFRVGEKPELSSSHRQRYAVAPSVYFQYFYGDVLVQLDDIVGVFDEMVGEL